MILLDGLRPAIFVMIQFQRADITPNAQVMLGLLDTMSTLNVNFIGHPYWTWRLKSSGGHTPRANFDTCLHPSHCHCGLQFHCYYFRFQRGSVLPHLTQVALKPGDKGQHRM